jgi:hypothetical protein
MEYYLFVFWIFIMISAFGRIAIAYYSLQEKLKTFETNKIWSNQKLG